MGIPGLLGVLMVARHASTQIEIVFQHPVIPLCKISNNKSEKFELKLCEASYVNLSHIHSKEYRSLASLLLPSDDIFKRGFEFVIQTESSPHLRFLCYPCILQGENKSILLNTNSWDLDSSPQDENIGTFNTTPIRRKSDQVEQFSLILVFDLKHPIDIDTLLNCVESFSRALMISEYRFGHLSNEVAKINQLVNEHTKSINSKDSYNQPFESNLENPCHNEALSTSLTEINGILIESSSLCQNLYQFYESLHQKREAKLFIDGWINCHVSAFSEAQQELDTNSEVTLVNTESNVEETFPCDIRSLVRRFCFSAKSKSSLDDLVIDLCAPTSGVKQVAQHLSYWGKIHLNHKILDHDIFAINYDQASLSKLAQENTTFLKNFSWSTLELSEILNLFSKRATIRSARQLYFQEVSKLKPFVISNDEAQTINSNFEKIAKWLLAKSLIYKLKTQIIHTANLLDICDNKPSSLYNGKFSEMQLDDSPPYLLVQNDTATILIALLCNHLGLRENLNPCFNKLLTTIYLYLKEQLFLSQVDHNEELTNATSEHSFATMAWNSNQELNDDIITDISELSKEFPIYLTDILIYFLELFSTSFKSFDKYTSDEPFRNIEINDEQSSSQIFREFILFRKYGILSDFVQVLYL